VFELESLLHDEVFGYSPIEQDNQNCKYYEPDLAFILTVEVHHLIGIYLIIFYATYITRTFHLI
jgi:hypothetical protein